MLSKYLIQNFQKIERNYQKRKKKHFKECLCNFFQCLNYPVQRILFLWDICCLQGFLPFTWHIHVYRYYMKTSMQIRFWIARDMVIFNSLKAQLHVFSSLWVLCESSISVPFSRLIKCHLGFPLLQYSTEKDVFPNSERH